MKAINITTTIKNNNSSLYNGINVGQIIVINNIPKSFVSQVYNAGQRTDGYHTLDNSIHQSDGFYDVVIPTYDEVTQNLGDIFFDVDKFTYPVVAKTQQEQDDYQQQQEDIDQASTQIQQYKTDGQIGFDRAMSLINRRRINGVITNNQAISLAQGLYPSLEPLYKGLWQLVKQNLDSETPPANQDLLNIFNIIKNNVDQYVLDNY